MPAPRPIPAALRSGPFTPADARAGRHVFRHADELVARVRIALLRRL